MSQRRLTDAENIELHELNAAVAAALKARKDWLDAKMVETSDLQVGDDIYDITSGVKVGVVSELYRYQSGRNDLFDTHISCDYQYKTSFRGFDNTSRQIGRRFGTREEAERYAESKLESLRAASNSVLPGYPGQG